MKRRGERERRRKDPGCWVSRIGWWPCYGWLLSSGSGRKTEANLLLPESILQLLRKCWNLCFFLFFKKKKRMLTFPVFTVSTFPSISSGLSSLCRSSLLSPPSLWLWHYLFFSFAHHIFSLYPSHCSPTYEYLQPLFKQKRPFLQYERSRCEHRKWVVIIDHCIISRGTLVRHHKEGKKSNKSNWIFDFPQLSLSTQ